MAAQWIRVPRVQYVHAQRELPHWIRLGGDADLPEIGHREMYPQHSPIYIAEPRPLSQGLHRTTMHRRRPLPRCELAGVPGHVEFATKPALALEMIQSALDAGVAVGLVTGDECYGRDPLLRQALQQRGVGYVLAVARNHYARIDTHLKERVDVT